MRFSAQLDSGLNVKYKTILKNLQSTNTLAYFGLPSVTKKQA